MGMTLTEKILAKHAGKDSVAAKDNIWINVDKLMTHDVCGPGTIGIFKREFGESTKVWDKDNIIIIPDHYIFTKDKHAMRNLDILREFAEEQNITYFYDAFTDKYSGVCHVTLAEKGHNIPGEVMFGTDSHTCTSGAFGMFSSGIGNTDAAFIMGTGKLWVKVPETMRFVFNGTFPKHIMAKDIILRIIGDIGVAGATYRAMEFAGSAIEALSMEERMTICNMAIEAGGKSGIIAPDEKTVQFVKEKTGLSPDISDLYSDEDAVFFKEIVYDASTMDAVIAKPHSPDNMAFAKDISDQKVDRSYIGSCTGGKLTDFIAAAKILDGKKVVIDTFIVPSTKVVESQLSEEMVNGKTLLDIFKSAGCRIGEASCAACLGGPEDTFGRTHDSERVVSTTNRNFPGRMGSAQSSVYLASPYTAALSATTGYITDPREAV
jgi:3-isopropylmalate/(R)-2-methylmalate dehydratase large subunit